MTTVELLLRLGADPNAADGGGRTPLYSVGNECKVAGAGKVVHALVRAGAKVDAHDGVKHCTALHMAARRGNVDVAEALLDCDADIEARDTLGETPLGVRSTVIRPRWPLYFFPEARIDIRREARA